MHSSIDTFIGNTPLVKLQRIPARDGIATTNVILSKLEGNNPAGSVKDRPAISMISRAEARGEIRPGDILFEATSGNTGIALAMAAAIKGYRMVLVMPEHLSMERRQTMQAFGAELVLTPQSIGMDDALMVTPKSEDGAGAVGWAAPTAIKQLKRTAEYIRGVLNNVGVCGNDHRLTSARGRGERRQSGFEKRCIRQGLDNLAARSGRTEPVFVRIGRGCSDSLR